MKWTLTGATTEYTVQRSGRFLSLVAWGPHGVSDGPAPLAFHGRVQYMTPGDVAAVEYATDGLRPFLGPDLALEQRSAYWDLVSVDDTNGLHATFADPVTGLRAVQHYRFAPARTSSSAGSACTTTAMPPCGSSSWARPASPCRHPTAQN